MTKNDEFVKVIFELEIEEDGWPPISAETFNALLLEDGTFQLDNTPFFVENIALGDIVTGDLIEGSGNRYWFKEVIQESQNTSLSIIFLDKSLSESVYQKMRGHGCYCEYGEFGSIEMLAVSVLEGIDYSEIFDYLMPLLNKELLSFAELALARP